jgi:hypothetical protein
LQAFFTFAGSTGTLQHQEPTLHHMKPNHPISALLCAFSMSISAFATIPEEAKEIKVTIKVSNIPTATVLEHISQITKIKTHYTAPKNDPLVTGDFKDIPADQMFTFVGKLANLAVSYKDDGVYFATKQ